MKRLRNRIVFSFVCLIVFSIFGFADTNVSGIIDADTTWTKAASPYIVTDSIIINQGKTLTIEPGVVIKFEKGKTLRVDGALIARGTAQDRIVFTSNAIPKNKGDWGSILFSATCTGPSYDTNGNYTAGSILENCKVEYGGNTTTGVLWYKSPFIIKDCIIENNLGCAIYDVSQNESDKSKILKNIIYNNDQGGILVYSVFSPMIQKNLIIDNNKAHKPVPAGGIAIRTDRYDIRNNILVNNFAEGDNFGGLSAKGFSNSIISNNSFIGNSGSLYIFNFSNSPGNPKLQFLKNTIVSSFSDTHTEIDCWYVENKESLDVYNNNIFNSSSGYSFSNNSTISLDAKNNWWGTINEDSIKSKIYDGLDNISLGIVTYSPFLTTPDTDAPISPPTITKKEAVAGGVKITWATNPESDTKGYKIYWGSPTGYSFANSVDVGNVTSYTLSGASMSDTIAVTAYDNDYASAADDPATIINENQTDGTKAGIRAHTRFLEPSAHRRQPA